MDGEPARYLDLAVDGLKNKRAAPSTRPSKGTRNVAAPPAVGSARGCDPPREAKEGYEWVWFPEGYWAEREIVPAFENFKAYDNKFWKWRSKSSRGQNLSEGEPRNVSPKTTGQPSPSPKTMVQSPFAAPPAIPPTPFMSERDHIHSLQHPHGQHNESCASEFLGFTVPKTTVPQAKRSSNSSGPDVVAEASPFPLEQAERQPGRHLSQARKDLAGATLKSKEKTKGGPPGRDDPLHTTADASRQSYFGLFPSRRSSVATKGDDEQGGMAASRPKALRPRPSFESMRSVSKSGLSSQVQPSLRTMMSTTFSTTTSIHSWQQPEEDDERKETPFPAGEATRVPTPPEAQDELRGIYVNLSAPSSVNNFARPRSPNSGPQQSSSHAGGAGTHGKGNHRKGGSSSSKQKGPRSPSSTTPSHRTMAAKRHAHFFDFDVPEHDPDSPLCPANQTSGKGLCVYHGRHGSFNSDANTLVNPTESRRNDGLTRGPGHHRGHNPLVRYQMMFKETFGHRGPDTM